MRHCLLVRSGGAISMKYFSADLRCRLQGFWREIGSVDPRRNNNKLATYPAWFATPFACNAHQTYVPASAHTLKVESAVWQDGTSVCDRHLFMLQLSCPRRQ
eukprot:644835-Pelagomonas_calceolata.AAC.1